MLPAHCGLALRSGILALNGSVSRVPGEPQSGPGLFDLIPRGSLKANVPHLVRDVAETNVVPEIGGTETVLVRLAAPVRSAGGAQLTFTRYVVQYGLICCKIHDPS